MKVLILGATSGIGQAVGAELAARGYSLILTGRDLEETRALAEDLHLRQGVETTAYQFDALAFSEHQAAFELWCRGLEDGLEGAIICYGYLGEQERAQVDFAEARRIIDTNFTAVVSMAEILAIYFEEQARGFICVLSSVAGDRGRRGLYTYGGAKAGLSVYLQGMNHRLSNSGVRVINIKLGRVDTRMTYGAPPSRLMASPEGAAKGVCSAIRRGRPVAYVPWFYRPMMFLVRNIPERIFRRINV